MIIYEKTVTRPPCMMVGCSTGAVLSFFKFHCLILSTDLMHYWDLMYTLIPLISQLMCHDVIPILFYMQLANSTRWRH